MASDAASSRMPRHDGKVSSHRRAPARVPLGRKPGRQPPRRQFPGRGSQHASPEEEQRERDRHRQRQPPEVVRDRIARNEHAHEEREVRRHRPDGDRRGHQRRAEEGQRDDRVARREGHGSVSLRSLSDRTAQRRRRRPRASSCRDAAPRPRPAASPPRRRTSSSTFTPSSETPPCPIARRASLRLATSPVSTSACTTGVPLRQFGMRQFPQRAGQRRRVERSKITLSEEGLGCRDRGVRGIRTVHEARHLERDALLADPAERLCGVLGRDALDLARGSGR